MTELIANSSYLLSGALIVASTVVLGKAALGWLQAPACPRKSCNATLVPFTGQPLCLYPERWNKCHAKP
jgi:hypothetical protein